MSEAKRPLKVFLCHAHADRDAVRALYARLTKDGVDAWLDKEKLLPGQDWEFEIRKAVRKADVVVVCLSKQFNQAGFRQKEVRLALDTAMEKPEGEIFIIPARLDECDTLESLRRWHWVDLFEGDGYEKLIQGLRKRADDIGASLRKKNRLPKVATTNVKQEKPSHEKEKSESQSLNAREEIRVDSINLTTERSRLSKTKSSHELNKVVVMALIGFSSLIILIYISLPSIIPYVNQITGPKVTVTLTNSPTATRTLVPIATKTKVPISTITPTITPTFTPIPTSSILLQEDFEDNKANGWVANGGIWAIEQDVDGNRYLLVSGSQFWHLGDWTDYAFEFRVKPVKGTGFSIWVHAYENYSFYMLSVDFVNNGVAFYQYKDNLTTRWTLLGGGTITATSLDRWYTFRVEINGDRISAYMDNTFILGADLPSPLVNKQGGVGLTNDEGEIFHFDDAKVWSLK